MKQRTTGRCLPAVVAAGMLFLAASPAPAVDVIYYACVNKSSGTLKVVTKNRKCTRQETKISWNQQGVRAGSFKGRLVSACPPETPGHEISNSVDGFTVLVPGYNYQARTAPDGAFQFDLVAPGSYDLLAEKSERTSLELGTVVVTSGMQTVLEDTVIACSDICGDALTSGGEQCDDGNTANGDGCSVTCTIEPVPVCGDGVVQAGEQCDDSNTNNGDGCSSTCVIE